mgnify:FL=1
MEINITIKEKIENEKSKSDIIGLTNSLQKFLERGEIRMQDLASIDRIEGEYAVCELSDGNMVDIPLKDFKEIVSEGDIFDLEIIYKEGCKIYNVKGKNVNEMNLRREKILEKLNKIQNKKNIK